MREEIKKTNFGTASEPETFVCDNCGGTFPKEWSDEEAEKESQKIFGKIEPEEQATVCDDCFKEIVADYSKMN